MTAVRLGMEGFEWNFLYKAFEEFTKQIVVYIVGPFRALEYGINHYADIIGVQFGRATLGGIDEIFYYLGTRLFPDFKAVNHIIGPLTNQEIFVSNTQTFNALFTSTFTFYCDYRLLGVVIIPFAFGNIVRYSITSLCEYPTVAKFFLMQYLFINLITSSLKWRINTPEFVIVIILLFVWNKRFKKSQN